ncbi:DUF3696 domain-containing protein [Pseudomonas syringae]|uniref:DUF3696 domain-containing protein n=1 Tax=Pseudomonas syringae TaxID=317 RepID=UPI003F7A0D17
MTRMLKLHNFKAFKNQEIELRPLTVLSGLNGSGKSTTLQALALLRQSFDAGFFNQKGLLLNGDLVELGTGADILHDQHDDELISIKINNPDDQNYFIYETSYLSASDILPIREAYIVGNPIPGFLDNGFQYLKADRVSPAVNYPKSHHVVSDRRFLGAKGEFTAHFLHCFRDEVINDHIRRHPSTKATAGLLSQVNAWLQEISLGARVNVEEVPRTDFMRLEYSYGNTAGISGTNLFRPTNVGFGLTYALPIIVACLASPAGSLVMIENPEAHLHPQGQIAIGDLIARAASAGVQVLIETHSDHVLNGIRIAVKEKVIPCTSVGLNFFRRDSGSSQPSHQQPEISENGRLSEWPDGFFDQWDKALDRILD